MKSKILISLSVGLSLFASAQSQTDKQKSKPATIQVESRDTASGQASGKIAEQKVIHRDLAARDTASGQASGKKTAHDDWQQPSIAASNSATTKPVSANAAVKTHVAAGDVNGNGAADATANKNSAHATESLTGSSTSSKQQSSQDLASGHPTGKRQHQPISMGKTSDNGKSQ
jgi:hypothetical protein